MLEVTLASLDLSPLPKKSSASNFHIPSYFYIPSNNRDKLENILWVKRPVSLFF
ncbi:hypothetical protein EMIT07CA2_30288 [Brevibacillus sp. IT-7CA2]